MAICKLIKYTSIQYKNDFIKQINNKNVLKYWDIDYPYNQNEYSYFEEWIKKIRNKEEKFESFAIINNKNKFCGIISIRSIKDYPDTFASIGYWLGEEYWNKGIGRESLKLACEYAFNKLHIKTLEGYVFKQNIASIKVLEKNGFTYSEILRKNYNIKGIIDDELVYTLTNPRYT